MQYVLNRYVRSEDENRPQYIESNLSLIELSEQILADITKNGVYCVAPKLQDRYGNTEVKSIRWSQSYARDFREIVVFEYKAPQFEHYSELAY